MPLASLNNEEAAVWEYRWVEVEVGDAAGLSALGRDDWEAVSSTLVGEHFGRKLVGVLMKRAAAPRAIDLATYEATPHASAAV